ncbi:D-alanyl-D-alanine carboxypeptidase family protein [Xanthobacter sp. V3C-3]|uniref:D-alanyl-D-alanine carboxypeptidase family protein n=1 Tax=Xanthobacter lutulentifluminis TaxID=3119935 RepID=UPI0037266AF5
MTTATCDTGHKFMRTSPAGLAFTTKALAFAVLAAFTLTTTVADAKPRKKTQVERKDRSKASSKSRAVASAPSSGREDASRWHYGSSAIIVDANTGKVLYEDNADALRHPASVTKIMTLYLLFEQLEAGNLKLDSNLQVSAKAASQQPSKLNVKPGSTIEVEDAIKALVTRSANDVAVVIAENLGGTESDFADMMTAKARALGMSRTVFRNASGLPNPNQVTTARDLSILGRAVQDRFPKQYRYFSTRTFYYRGQAIGNHNRLLGRVEGVDGIKTGYTQASGFNLVTSVKRDGRYLVGVVLGGSSAGSRDARMTGLINQNLSVAYAGMRTAPKVTEVAEAAIPVSRPLFASAPAPVAARRDEEQPHAVAPLPKPAAAQLAGGDPATTASIPQGAGVKPGSAEPIRPTAVKTVAVQRPSQAGAANAPAPTPAPVQTASRAAPQPASQQAATQSVGAPILPVGFSAPAGVLGYLGPSSGSLSPAAAAAQAAAQGQMRHTGTQTASAQPAAAAPQAPAGKDTSRLASAVASTASEEALRAARIAAMEPDDAYARAVRAAQRRAEPAAAPQRPIRTASLAPVAVPQQAAAPKPAASASAIPASARSGWGIQIGAFGGEREAKAKLDAARSRAKSVLGSADPYTEKVTKGSSDLYRARFSGLTEKNAREACRLLKRNDFDCMTLKN